MFFFSLHVIFFKIWIDSLSVFFFPFIFSLSIFIYFRYLLPFLNKTVDKVAANIHENLLCSFQEFKEHVLTFLWRNALHEVAIIDLYLWRQILLENPWSPVGITEKSEPQITQSYCIIFQSYCIIPPEVAILALARSSHLKQPFCTFL